MASLKMLVVGDDAALEMLRHRVAPLHPGYQFHFASGARQALDLLAAEPVDLVLSASQLGKTAGVEFLTTVRDLYPETVRILGLAAGQDPPAPDESGPAQLWLQQPYQPEALAALLQHHCRQPAVGQSGNRLRIRQGRSQQTTIDEAVRELATQLAQPDTKITLLFFSDEYDPARLGPALKEHFTGTVVGCTTAGQLTERGFQRGGISGASLASDELQTIPYLIHPLSCQADQIAGIATDIHQRQTSSQTPAFGFLLVDGLSLKEESLISQLYMALGNIPLVGGSAGDSLRFRQTFVYFDGRLLQDAAVLTLFFTTLPFQVFKHQHFLPTGTRLVITESDSAKRLVREINGEPAAEAYARLIGTSVDQLCAETFSKYPLMLKIGNDYFVRSVASVEPDRSLRFFCAIESGLVLTVGQGESAMEALNRDLDKLRGQIGEPALIIGCDCILRRLEMEAHGIDDHIGRMMARSKVVGFSTYGEQFNSVHVNQTFTGIAIAGGP